MKKSIEEMTVGEVLGVARLFKSAAPKAPRACPFKVGNAYLIRTVTNYWTGRVAEVVGGFLVLSDAAWIADTGRYSEATDEAHLKEVEPCNEPVFVALGSVIDARLWSAALPRKVK